jgi:hypothetical protein
MDGQAVGVRHDVVLAGGRQLEAGAMVRPDLQVQRQVLRTGGALADRVGRLVGDGDFRRRAIGRSGPEQRVQFATGVKLPDDVRTADQFALHVQLRDRRPVAVGLDALADLRVVQHVDRVVVRQQFIKRVGGGGRKAAHRLLPVALHEQHHAVLVEQGLDAFAGGGFEGHGGGSVGRAVDHQ